MLLTRTIGLAVRSAALPAAASSVPPQAPTLPRTTARITARF
jgi:hypothetical protein